MSVSYLGSTDNGTQYRVATKEHSYDYTGLYEDLLEMQLRAESEAARRVGGESFYRFAEECREFRLEILALTRSPLARIRV